MSWTQVPQPAPVADVPVSRAPRRRRGSTAVAVLIAVLSLVLAGVIAQYRDRTSGVSQVHAQANQTVTLVPGQTIQLNQVRGGVSLTNGTHSSLTRGRFLVLQLVAITQHERKVSGLRCRAVLDGQDYALSGGMVPLPESGMKSINEMVLEVPLDGLDRVQLACRDSSAIYLRAVDVTFDLGLADELDSFVAATGYTTVEVADRVTEGLP